MEKKLVFCIIGKKRNGKGETSKAIEKYFLNKKPENNIQIIKLADPIKEMLCCLLKVDRKKLEDNKGGEINGIKIRHAMQTLGTEWGRGLIDKDIWIDILVKKINMEYSNIFIVEDVRFPNELEKIQKSFKTVVIKIIRSKIVSTDTHESEIHELPYDFLILNDTSILDLHEKITKILQENHY